MVFLQSLLISKECLTVQILLLCTFLVWQMKETRGMSSCQSHIRIEGRGDTMVQWQGGDLQKYSQGHADDFLCTVKPLKHISIQ